MRVQQVDQDVRVRVLVHRHRRRRVRAVHETDAFSHPTRRDDLLHLTGHLEKLPMSTRLHHESMGHAAVVADGVSGGE